MIAGLKSKENGQISSKTAKQLVSFLDSGSDNTPDFLDSNLQPLNWQDESLTNNIENITANRVDSSLLNSTNDFSNNSKSENSISKSQKRKNEDFDSNTDQPPKKKIKSANDTEKTSTKVKRSKLSLHKRKKSDRFSSGRSNNFFKFLPLDGD